MIDVLSAVKAAASPPYANNSNNLKKAQTYFGVYTGSGQVNLNKFFQSDAPEHEKRKSLPIQTTSDVKWNSLQPLKLFRLRGWSDIKAGNQEFSQHELEVLDIDEVCTFPNCIENPADFIPQLAAISSSDTSLQASTGFNLKFSGKNLIPYFGQETIFKVLFKPLGGNSTVSIPVKKENIQSIENDGTAFSVNLPSSETSKLTAGKYEVGLEVLKGFTGRMSQINLSGSDASSDFTINSVGGGGLSISSVQNTPPPASHPVNLNNPVYYRDSFRGYVTVGNTLEVDHNDFVGIYMDKKISGPKVKIGGAQIEVPVVSVMEDVLAFGITEDIPEGVHDLILTEAGGGTITIEDAIRKVSAKIPNQAEPPPPAGVDEYKTIELFNVGNGDKLEAFVNNNLVLTAQGGEHKTLDISGLLTTEYRNNVRFKAHNTSGSYTYGFRLKTSSGHIVYEDIQGTPGVRGAHYPNSEVLDSRTGEVYNEKITINKYFTPLGSGNFWAKVEHIDDKITVPTAPDFLIVDKSQGPIYREMLHIPASCDTCTAPYYFDHTIENFSLGYTWDVELYKGINLVYRRRHGRKGYWGANNNDQTKQNQVVLTEHLPLYLPADDRRTLTTVQLSSPYIFANGSESVTATINTKNLDGTPLAPGEGVYINVSGGSGSFEGVNGTIKNTLTSPQGGFAFTGQNGQVHVKFTPTYNPIEPYYYPDNWLANPSSFGYQFIVCKTHYFRGWHCDQQIFPNTQSKVNEGKALRSYTNSLQTAPNPLIADNGEPKTITVNNIKDKGGDIVPDGTTIYTLHLPRNDARVTLSDGSTNTTGNANEFMAIPTSGGVAEILYHPKCGAGFDQKQIYFYATPGGQSQPANLIGSATVDYREECR